MTRNHARVASGNRLRLPLTFPSQLNRPCVQPGLQRPCALAVCCISFRDETAVPQWCVFMQYLHPFPLNSCSLGTTPDHTAHIPLFLYPFLNTTSKTRPFEYLRLTSLGVIGALVKVRRSVRSSRLRIIRPHTRPTYSAISVHSKTTTRP